LFFFAAKWTFKFRLSLRREIIQNEDEKFAFLFSGLLRGGRGLFGALVGVCFGGVWRNQKDEGRIDIRVRHLSLLLLLLSLLLLLLLVLLLWLWLDLLLVLMLLLLLFLVLACHVSWSKAWLITMMWCVIIINFNCSKNLDF